ARRRIAVAFVHTFDRAPTRPHPYTPHSRRLGRAMHRIFSAVDRAMDVMDSRITPQRPVAPQPRTSPARGSRNGPTDTDRRRKIE
ncbi:MAG TPA: hypothetical protein VII16_13500, partial [Actinomycetes bacterium]